MSTKALPKAEVYFTIAEAALRMRVSDRFIKREITAGRLRAKNSDRTGNNRGKTLITATALDAWFDGLEDA